MPIPNAIVAITIRKGEVGSLKACKMAFLTSLCVPEVNISTNLCFGLSMETPGGSVKSACNLYKKNEYMRLQMSLFLQNIIIHPKISPSQP